MYTDNLESLYNYKLYESLLCSDLNCKDKSHVHELSSIYSNNTILNYVIIIGWNDRIKSLNIEVRNAFLF